MVRVAIVYDRNSIGAGATRRREESVTVSKFSVRARLRSFVYAGRGLRTLLATQHNARIHGGATLLVVGAALGFRLGRMEWLVLILTLVSVWTAESLNTAFEFLCDAASPEFHPLVEKAKDVAAGAVLIAALGALVVGVLVFAPHVSAALAEAGDASGFSAPSPPRGSP